MDESTRPVDLSTRRQFLRTGLVTVAAAGLWPGARAAAAGAPRGRPARPNIILAMTDDQGWGDVGYNGNADIKTPTLDDMAAKGLRFNRFYAAAPVCSPTRASCMTGRHPNRSGVFSWGYDLPLEEVTLAEALKAAGYATGHFGKWHLGGIGEPPSKRGRTNRGKKQFARPPHPGNQGFDEWFSYFNFFDLNPGYFYHNGEAVGPLEGDGSDITVDRAVAWIRKMAAAKRPFFAVVWFGNPHGPHKALEKDRAPYAGLSEKLQHYNGEITGVDRGMATLRNALGDMGVRENTMLWFTSDNGGTGPANNGGLRGKKGSLWEGGIRVPGILEWPARVTRPFTTDVPASTSDYYPTILDLVGAGAPNQVRPLDGISLAALIDGKMTERPSPIAFEVRTSKTAVRSAALVGNRYKLHQSAGGKGKARADALYDLVDDPAETKDIASEKPKVLADMKAMLETWQKSVVRSLEGKDYRRA